MRDIWTIFKKEIKEWLRARDNARWTLVTLAISIGIFGIMMPLQSPQGWREGIAPAALYLFLPLFVANNVVADSFAGERERKTLETLLATRLPDWAIFLGKVAASVAYSWGLSLVAALVGMITVNLSSPGQGLYLYPLPTAIIIVFGGLLTALLAVGIGVFISLRAKSVRAAQQAFGLVFLVIVLGLSYGLPALLNGMSETQKVALDQTLTNTGVGPWIALLLLGLALIDAVLMAVAIRRFERTRLILD